MKEFLKKHWRKFLSIGLVLTFICTLPGWNKNGHIANEDVNETLKRYENEAEGDVRKSYPEYNWPEYQEYLKAGEVVREAANVVYSIDPDATINLYGGAGWHADDPANQAGRNYMLQYYPDLPVGKTCTEITFGKFVDRIAASALQMGYKLEGRRDASGGYSHAHFVDAKTGEKVDLWNTKASVGSSQNQSSSANASGSNNTSGSSQKSSRSTKGNEKKGSSGSSTNSKETGKDTSGQTNNGSTGEAQEPEPTLTALSDDSKAKEMVIVKEGVPIWCNFYGKAGQYTGEDNNRILPIGQHVTITGVTSNGFYQLYAAGNPSNTTFRINVSKDTEGATPYYIDINGMDPNDPFIVPLSEYKGSWIFTGTYQAATCTKDGWKEEKNDLTGQTRHVKIPKIPHHTTDYVVTKKPGLFLSGKKEAVCIVCHKVVKTKKIPSKISSFFSGKKNTSTKK